MPAIQDVYSVNVSNRFALAVDNELDDGTDSDSYADFDPLDQLRLIEEQQQKRGSKKKGKVQQTVPSTQENNKSVPSKKEVQFKENKDANVPSKKQTDSKKDDKSKTKRESSVKEPSTKPVRANEKAPPGDENRRPKRQNNRVDKPTRDRGEGDQFSRSYDDSADRPNRKGPMNNSGEGRTDRRDRGGSRYERYRGSRGGYRGSYGGSYGYRNNYRSDGRDDRGKREFDRRSGSDKAGVRPSDKRDGGGPRNWGTPGNEIEETVNNTTFEQEEGGNWGDQVEQEEQEEKQQKSDTESKKEGNEEDAVPEPAAEEDNTPTEMTLDEWKAMQGAAPKKRQFNIRQPGEGEDAAKWTNMEIIHESTINKPVQHNVLSDANLRSHQTKPAIDVNIRFDMPPRSGGRGGRGGRGFRGGRGGYRGGQRGGGGRYGGNRYGTQHPPPPDVLNEKEFPTLAAA